MVDEYLWLFVREKFNKWVESFEVEENKDETCVMRDEQEDSILKWKADDHDLLSAKSWMRKSIFTKYITKKLLR